jgi:hypothetical protein
MQSNDNFTKSDSLKVDFPYTQEDFKNEFKWLQQLVQTASKLLF